MDYTIYKTTNMITGKIYIGKHICRHKNCPYLGSGKILVKAIEKYGKEYFSKEILFVFDTEDEMNAKEAELVNEEFISSGVSYNLCLGGKGGWGFANANPFLIEKKKEHLKKYAHIAAKLGGAAVGAQNFRKAHSLGKISYDNFAGHTHSEETKAKMSEKAKINSAGIRNSQFGTIWITNGIENRKIKKDQNIPEEWYKGRILKISRS